MTKRTQNVFRDDAGIKLFYGRTQMKKNLIPARRKKPELQNFNENKHCNLETKTMKNNTHVLILSKHEKLKILSLALIYERARSEDKPSKQ